MIPDSLGPGPSFRYAYEGEDENLNETNVPKVDKVLVFPNPATDMVTVVLPTDPEKPWSLNLSSVSGTVVREMNLYGRVQRVKLSGISSGLYYIRIYADNKEQRYAEKFVIVNE